MIFLHRAPPETRRQIADTFSSSSTHRETGEHIQDAQHNLQYIPFSACAETGLPLELHYGIDTELNCTIPVTDEFYHLLEFYIHSDAPLTCRLPARPPPTVALHPESLEAKDIGGSTADGAEAQEYVPLIFALAGTLQLSHLHVSTHMNILLHSVPKHHLHNHDSGVIDSGAAYSTSPLAGTAAAIGSTGAYTHLPHLNHNQKLIIGDDLKLQFDIRWFPTPKLPSTNGKVEWNGMGGHVYASTVFYILVAFGAGCAVCTVYFWGVVLPKRLKGRGRNLGGATPLGGYGLGAVGNGWGVSGKRD